MKSILQEGTLCCFVCGRNNHLEEHHVFYGTANRKLSEKYGLKVKLCHNCHNEPPGGVHHNKESDRELKNYAQLKAMEFYGWSTEDFIRIFGKNYL